MLACKELRFGLRACFAWRERAVVDVWAIGMSTCKAQTKAGTPCRMNAGTSGYCLAHDPEQREKRAAACRRGGQRRAGRLRPVVLSEAEAGTLELTTPAQVQKLLVDTIQQVRNPVEVGVAEPADDAGDLVALVEQQFGQVRSVLSRDARDDGALRHIFVPLSARILNRSRFPRGEARSGRRWRPSTSSWSGEA